MSFVGHGPKAGSPAHRHLLAVGKKNTGAQVILKGATVSRVRSQIVCQLKPRLDVPACLCKIRCNGAGPHLLSSTLFSVWPTVNSEGPTVNSEGPVLNRTLITAASTKMSLSPSMSRMNAPQAPQLRLVGTKPRQVLRAHSIRFRYRDPVPT